jgi:hypothetical protein
MPMTMVSMTYGNFHGIAEIACSEVARLCAGFLLP